MGTELGGLARKTKVAMEDAAEQDIQDSQERKNVMRDVAAKSETRIPKARNGRASAPLDGARRAKRHKNFDRKIVDRKMAEGIRAGGADRREPGVG